MDIKALPTDINDAHALIIELQREAQNNLLTLKQKQLTLAKQDVALELKDKLVAEQAHSLLELKGHNDKLDEKVTELNLRIEKLLQQLFGRKSERRLDGAGQLLLDLFAGTGWTPSRSTLANLEASVEFALRPLADYLRRYLKTDPCVGCD